MHVTYWQLWACRWGYHWAPPLHCLMPWSSSVCTFSRLNEELWLLRDTIQPHMGGNTVYTKCIREGIRLDREYLRIAPHSIHEYTFQLGQLTCMGIFDEFSCTCPLFYMYTLHVFLYHSILNNKRTLYRGLFKLFWTPTNTYWISESTFLSATVMFLSPASLLWHTSLKSEANAT